MADVGAGGKEEDVQYRGVKRGPLGQYVAVICDPYREKRVLLGSFNTAEEVARAYDDVARALRGPKAKTNFPFSDPSSGPNSGRRGGRHGRGAGGGRRNDKGNGGGGDGGSGNKNDVTTLFYFGVGAYNHWRSNCWRVKLLTLSFFLGFQRRNSKGRLWSSSSSSFRCRDSMSIGTDLTLATPCTESSLVA